MLGTHMKMPRSFALAALAALLAGAPGTALAGAPVPQHVSVIKLTHMDILRNGQPSGRMSLGVGTTLDVDGVDGDYVLVHIRLLKGRVPAADTDFDAMAAAPEGAIPQRAAPPPGDGGSPAPSSAPPKAAPPKPASASAPPAAKPMATSAADSPGTNPDFGQAARPMPRRPGPAFSGTFLFCFAAVFILMIASQWRLNVKAGKPGWACLVPFYNMIVYLQIAGKPTWWILLYFVPLVNIVVSVMSVLAFAGKFGKGTGFALGIVFLPFVFLPILAFGDDPYIG
jgi:uncharacterized protein DUF5684